MSSFPSPLLLAVLAAFVAAAGCRKKKPEPDASPTAFETATTTASGGEAGVVSRGAGSPLQSAPTIKGLEANSDQPMARALAGNDAQAHLKALNELLVVWEQTNTGQPFTDPEDLVKGGFLSRLPSPPPGMEFVFNPKRHAVELAPLGVTIRGVGANSDNPLAKALAGNDAQTQLKMLNELLMVWEQTDAGRSFTAPEDLVKAGLLSRLPNPPPGAKFVFNPKQHAIELVPR